ncbi:MAG: TrmH family RNA methyltransferase, partial [Cyanobacteriota bacterium]
MLSIVLIDPQIPPNTGNIARLCSCTGSSLYLVGNLGFFLTDKHLKRAGLDYWEDLNFKYYENLDLLFNLNSDKNFYYITTKGKHNYTDITYTQNDFLVFGSETKGLPE